MESKEERTSLPLITSLCALHSLDCLEMSTELYREEKREEVTEVARRIKGESKGERQIQPIIRSLSVLHRLEHTEILSVG